LDSWENALERVVFLHSNIPPIHQSIPLARVAQQQRHDVESVAVRVRILPRAPPGWGYSSTPICLASLAQKQSHRPITGRHWRATSTEHQFQNAEWSNGVLKCTCTNPSLHNCPHRASSPPMVPPGPASDNKASRPTARAGHARFIQRVGSGDREFAIDRHHIHMARLTRKKQVPPVRTGEDVKPSLPLPGARCSGPRRSSHRSTSARHCPRTHKGLADTMGSAYNSPSARGPKRWRRSSGPDRQA